MGIAEKLAEVRTKIRHAAVRSGRGPGEVKLIAVSKTVSLKEIMEAAEAGVTIFGENRVQEAKDKITGGDVKKHVEWHLIGHLQKNKAGDAVRLFDMIQSVDSAALAETVNKRAAHEGKKQRILIQVKLSGETAKHGAAEKDLDFLADRIANMGNLRLQGLMTMPPFFENPEDTRPYFIRLRELRDDLAGKGYPVDELSMGMSHDYEPAVEEGSTMVRIGTAIFGERSY